MSRLTVAGATPLRSRLLRSLIDFRGGDVGDALAEQRLPDRLDARHRHGAVLELGEGVVDVVIVDVLGEGGPAARRLERRLGIEQDLLGALLGLLERVGAGGPDAHRGIPRPICT